MQHNDLECMATWPGTVAARSTLYSSAGALHYLHVVPDKRALHGTRVPIIQGFELDTLIEEIQEALGDRYIVEREIGRGGMATVFLAQERRPRRPA